MRTKVSAAYVHEASPVPIEKAVQIEKSEPHPVIPGPLPTAWDGDEDVSRRSVLLGQSLVPYAAAEPCYLSVRSAAEGPYFVSARLGPLLFNDIVSKEESVKVVGESSKGAFECIVADVPLQQMSTESPMGVVACRFKVWAQSRIARRWLGCTLPVGVPSQGRIIRVGDLDLEVAVQRGVAAETASKRGVRAVRFREDQTELPPQDAIQVVGRHVLRLASHRHWGLGRAMLQELQFAPAEAQRAAMAEADNTKRTALRLCIDGLWAEQPDAVQALEGAKLITLLGARRLYFWELRISAVCHRTGSFLGETRIGMPRSHGGTLASVKPWTAPISDPCVGQSRWSEAKPCNGTVELTGKTASQVGRLQMEDTDLALLLVQPGEAVPFGSGSFRNPLEFGILAVQGRIVGSMASGLFDLPTCARVAGESQACGPCEVAAASVACGADAHALADDGLSPFTAALLGEDPCGLLSDVDPHLRARLRRNDVLAWAEIGRSSAGSGRMDLVATPLTRGLAVPEDLAESLLAYCFQANLPLLAMRVLVWIDGQQNLIEALERAEDPLWLRVVQRILQQNRSGTPCWCTASTLPYALEQIQRGRRQFQLFVNAFLEQIRIKDQDFFVCPAVLHGSGAECSICFEPLCRNTPVAFTEAGRAVCQHFLCSGCARDYAATSNDSGSTLRCPECRRSGSKVALIPQVTEDPLAWFNFLASEENTLNRMMLLRAVSAMLPADAEQLASAMGEHLLPDSPEGQEISAVHFLVDGLYAWIQRHEEEHRRHLTKGPPPSISDRTEWFKYWDVSQNGFLSRGEVLRAMLRISGISSLEVALVEDCQRRVDRLWDRCSAIQKRRNGHCSRLGVSCQEFVETGGLGDLLEEALSASLERGAQSSSSSASAQRRKSAREQRREKQRIASQDATVQAGPQARKASKEAWGVDSSSPDREATTESTSTEARGAATASLAEVMDETPGTVVRALSESSLSGSEADSPPRRERRQVTRNVPRSETRQRKSKARASDAHEEALRAVAANIPSWLSELTEASPSSGSGSDREVPLERPHATAEAASDEAATRDAAAGEPEDVPASAPFSFMQLFERVRRSISDMGGVEPVDNRAAPILVSI